jgi:putative transcriptional regulator
MSVGGRAGCRVRISGAWRLAVAVIVSALVLPAAEADPATGGAPPLGNITGQFLVATDELRDPRFTRTVVYIVRHSDEGAMGFVVNRPIATGPLAEVLAPLGMDTTGIRGEITAYYGGPVEPALGFILHTIDYVGTGTLFVKGTIALTANPAILRDIGRGAGPRRSLFAMGYAGWSPGQLEGEIAAGHWEVVPADETLLFDENNQTKWERAMARRSFRL